MTEKVATQLKEVYDKGRTAKNLIPPEHGPTGQGKATTTCRNTTRSHCDPNYT